MFLFMFTKSQEFIFVSEVVVINNIVMISTFKDFRGFCFEGAFFPEPIATPNWRRYLCVTL